MGEIMGSKKKMYATVVGYIIAILGVCLFLSLYFPKYSQIVDKFSLSPKTIHTNDIYLIPLFTCVLLATAVILYFFSNIRNQNLSDEAKREWRMVFAQANFILVGPSGFFSILITLNMANSLLSNYGGMNPFWYSLLVVYVILFVWGIVNIIQVSRERKELAKF